MDKRLRTRGRSHPSQAQPGVARLLACVLGVCLAGCGVGSGTRKFSSGIPVTGDVTGTWEGAFERSIPGGAGPTADRELERHTWRLRQVGEQVQGMVFVELTLVSGDGRPYLCSGKTQLTAWVTSKVEGTRIGSRLVIREVGKPRLDGVCHPPARKPARFEAQLQGDTLAVTGDQTKHQLVRRQSQSAKPRPSAAELATIPPHTTLALISPPGTQLGPHDPAALHGHWVWEQQNQLPNGDGKREREEWHLVQEGLEVVGFYDRTVEHRSNDGRLYRCNGAAQFRTVTRYDVRGLVTGPLFLMSEQSFEVLEGSPCDDGKRQLDSYQGEIRESHLLLKLGLTRQVLRKARPSVPTQSL